MILFFWLVVAVAICVMWPWMMIVFVTAGIIWLIIAFIALLMANGLVVGIALFCVAMVFCVLVLAG